MKIFSIFNTKNKIRYCILLVLMIIGAFLDMSTLAIIVPFINILSNDGTSRQFIQLFNIEMTSSQKILFLGSIIFILNFIRALYMPLLLKKEYNFVKNIEVNYAQNMVSNYLQQPYDIHMNEKKSEFIRDITVSLPNIFIAVIMGKLQLMTELFSCIMIVLFIFYIDFYVAMFFVIFFGMIVYFIKRLLKNRIYSEGKIAESSQADIIKWLTQSMNNIKMIKFLNKEYFFTEKTQLFFCSYITSCMRYQFYNNIPRYFIESIVIGGITGIITIGVFLNYPKDYIFFVMSAIAFSAFKIMPSISRIIGINTTIQYYMPLFNTLYNRLLICKESKKLEGNQDYIQNISFDKFLCFKSVSFKYEKSNNYVIKDFNYIMKKGEFIGLKGKSGSGKTTLVDLLLGLLLPISGTIEVDNNDICNYLNAWQKKCAYVPQETFLLEGESICKNILFGDNETNENRERVIHSLKASELMDVINNLPDGIDTLIGENGILLSGGQKQRIGIARAMYRNPQILVLDESTSALDLETEKNIMNTILKMKGRITIVAIAHRLSTLEHCDSIIDLDILLGGKEK